MRSSHHEHAGHAHAHCVQCLRTPRRGCHAWHRVFEHHILPLRPQFPGGPAHQASNLSCLVIMVSTWQHGSPSSISNAARVLRVPVRGRPAPMTRNPLVKGMALARTMGTPPRPCAGLLLAHSGIATSLTATVSFSITAASVLWQAERCAADAVAAVNVIVRKCRAGADGVNELAAVTHPDSNSVSVSTMSGSLWQQQLPASTRAKSLAARFAAEGRVTAARNR